MPVIIKRRKKIVDTKPKKDTSGKLVGELAARYPNWKPTIKEFILRLRRNMLIHSYLYYKLDNQLVPDTLWQQWADELVEVQKDYGTDWDYYDEWFADWDGSTGYHLPSDGWVVSKSNFLMGISGEGKCNTR